MDLGSPQMDLGSPDGDFGIPRWTLAFPQVGFGPSQLDLGSSRLKLGPSQVDFGVPKCFLALRVLILGSPRVGLLPPGCIWEPPEEVLGAWVLIFEVDFWGSCVDFDPCACCFGVPSGGFGTPQLSLDPSGGIWDPP